jgi:hypothetical protein
LLGKIKTLEQENENLKKRTYWIFYICLFYYMHIFTYYL